MIALAVIVFAFTISTESNRNFMRAPTWVPEVIGSDRTFGTSEHMANDDAKRLSTYDVGAITAIYDAFYERAYFGSVGPSNNWQEAADDYTGINVFKVGRNFDFFCKCLVYTNADGTVVGDTNNTGLVLTDSKRLLEYNNLWTFFTRAYNNFLNNNGVPLLERSTWATGNRKQYWACSRMPFPDGPGSVNNAFVDWSWMHGSRQYTGPSQQNSFIPLSAMSNQGALWSERLEGEHIVASLLRGTWSGSQIVYGEDDLARILPGGPTYGFYSKNPSDLFDNIYHLGTNGISEAGFTRRLVPDIYKDIIGNYYEPGVYSYKTNVMWSVPAALTLAASTLDTTIEELKLINEYDARDVLTTEVSWESTNESRIEGMQPWEHLEMRVNVHKVIDEFGLPRFVGSVDTHCPIPNNVIGYEAKYSLETNRVELPKNYGTYRFSGMLPGSPINPRINTLTMGMGVHTNQFDFLFALKEYANHPGLAGLEKTPVNISWIDGGQGSYVECLVSFPDADPEIGELMIFSALYGDLWVKDEYTTIYYDAFMDLEGTYYYSRSLPTAKEDSYYFAKPPQSDRVDSTTFHLAAAELMKVPDKMLFVSHPYTIDVREPYPVYFDIYDLTHEYYREYFFGGNEDLAKAIKIVTDRVESNVIGNTLLWTPGEELSMAPNNMLVGWMHIHGDMPVETMAGFRPVSPDSRFFVTFNEAGHAVAVYDSEESTNPLMKIDGFVYLQWTAYDENYLHVSADVEQLDSRNIRPPVEIDDRFGLLMKNTWKWKACGIK